MIESIMDLEDLNQMFLKLFTTEELYRKGIKTSNFEWKYNFKNINIIPILEVYNEQGVYKTFESIDFSKEIQDLLDDAKKLFEMTDKPMVLKEIDRFFKYLKDNDEDCSDCDLRDICPIRGR